MKSKFLISQAAKKAGVSRATLLYYDKIDLLSPSFYHENGYRYYTYKDLEKLELIHTLKESGLSLKSIKSFLDNPSHQEGIRLMTRQQEMVSERIQELQKLQIVLDKRVEMLNEYESIEFYDDIRLDYFPMITVSKMDLDHSLADPYESAVNALKDQLDESITSYGSIPSKYGLVIDIASFLDNQKVHVLSVYDYLSSPSDTVKSLQVPDSYYIRCIHKGAYGNAVESINRLIKHIDQHHYTITSNAYLVPLVDLWAASSEEEYLSEILIAVEIE